MANKYRQPLGFPRAVRQGFLFQGCRGTSVLHPLVFVRRLQLGAAEGDVPQDSCS